LKSCRYFLSSLIQLNDQEIIQHSCWALSYLTNGPNERIQLILDTGIAPRLISLLEMDATGILIPVVKTIGNIVSGDDTQTQYMLDNGIIVRLKAHLSSRNKTLRKETCWAISNILAGNKTQIQNCIDGDIFPIIINLLNDSSSKIRKEAIWCLYNASIGGTNNHVIYLAQHGSLEALSHLLNIQDPQLLITILDTFDNFLKVGETLRGSNNGLNPYAHDFESYGAVTSLETLLEHKNSKISYSSEYLIDTYFRRINDTMITDMIDDHNGNKPFSFE